MTTKEAKEATEKKPDKTYPLVLYYGSRRIDPHMAWKKLSPDGEAVVLSLQPSLKIRGHSPTGFEWGYSGSGPGQLALALLLDVTSDPDLAQGYYQDFKWDHVAGWGDSWEMTSHQILGWLHEQTGRRLEKEAEGSRN